jgi:ribosomal protein S18 acetylase RimI-like enzyme
MMKTREARIEDAEVISRLAAQLAAHQGDECKLDADKIRADGFGPNRAFSCVLGEIGGVVQGYSLIMPWYEPAAAARGLYVADLFVAPEFRGRGLGRMLLRAVAVEAVSRDFAFVGWLSKAWNKPAQDFYRNLGAVHEPTVGHALFGEALKRLVETPNS